MEDFIRSHGASIPSFGLFLANCQSIITTLLENQDETASDTEYACVLRQSQVETPINERMSTVYLRLVYQASHRWSSSSFNLINYIHHSLPSGMPVESIANQLTDRHASINMFFLQSKSLSFSQKRESIRWRTVNANWRWFTFWLFFFELDRDWTHFIDE